MAEQARNAHVVSRRTFLGTAAAAAAAPMVLPTGALARPGRPGPNDRLVFGHIGLGGMGRGHLGGTPVESVGALCDVDASRLSSALVDVYKRGARHDPLVCRDFRYILDRKDIDAVIVAAPDHWHAVMTVYACQAGKDVYVEKPACRTVQECRAMNEAVRRYRRVVQVGSQGRSTAAARKAAEFIQNGVIGRVDRVEAFHYPSPVGGTAEDSDPPPELDWDLWLGPHRWVPYNVDCVHFNFRWKFSFGGGQIKDRGAHIFSVALFVLNRDDFTLESVEATGELPPGGLWDCPTKYRVVYQFRNPAWTLVWNQTGSDEPMVKILGHSFGARYYGEHGELEVGGGDGGTYIIPEIQHGYTPPAGGVHIPESPGHRQNWEECIRTRKDPLMTIEAGTGVSLLCTLGNLSFRLGRKLVWDNENFCCVGDEQANRMLGEPQRGPWHL